MKSIFRATAILSGSSILSILVNLASAKVMALYLHPAGYGYYGLLQSFVGFAVLAAGMGMAAGMVRFGAAPASHGDQQTVARLRIGAWIVVAATGLLSLVICLLFQTPLSRLVIGDAQHGHTILWLVVPLVLTVGANLQVGIMNAHHRISTIARYTVLNNVVGAGINIAGVVGWGIRGILPAMIVGGIASYALSFFYLSRAVGPVRMRPTRGEALTAAWALLRFGGPYTLSMLFGAGIQFVLPIVILHLLDTEGVGLYKAATAISVGYLGFLVTAMGQDYFPRVSAVKDQRKELVKLINEQQRLVLLLSIPIVLGMLALVPILVPMVYSAKFLPAVEILEWQLIADLFKFSSWTMSFVILARCPSSVYFLTESIGGITNLLSTCLAVRFLGLPGLGIGFLTSYIVYYVVVRTIISRDINLIWLPANKRLMLVGIACAFAIRVLPVTPFASLRTAIALTLAFVVGAWCLYFIWQDMGRPTRLSSLRSLSEKV